MQAAPNLIQPERDNQLTDLAGGMREMARVLYLLVGEQPERADYGDVSEETQAMLEADFFAAVR